MGTLESGRFPVWGVGKGWLERTRRLSLKSFNTVNRLPARLVFLLSCLAFSLEAQAALPTPPAPEVWERRLDGFDESSYARALGEVLADFERVSGRRLVPGERGAVALKVFSGGGAGIATPRPLVRALTHLLEERGFERSRIFLVDLYELRLRDSGLLPPLSMRDDTFDGLEVRVLDSGRWYDERWYYDSALPAQTDTSVLQKDAPVPEERPEQRRSLLAAPLLFDVDFWINLPVFTDHPAFGVNGALANATLWNASNTLRFFRSRNTAPGAIAEMAAIPELRSTWRLTIVSLERYQYIGGPGFNSFYTASEPLLWASQDPVVLDALARERMDALRVPGGFSALTGELPLLKLAEGLGVGMADTGKAVWRMRADD